MRKRIYEIIEVGNDNDVIGKIYDYFMIAVILLSLYPLCFIHVTPLGYFLDYATSIIFILDYILRWITFDFKKPGQHFIRYPFTPLAIIDLLSILPTFINISTAFKVFKIVRLFKAFRVLKFFRYSKNVRLISNVIKNQKSKLITVGWLALSYVIISALIVFQVEPETFGNLFKAIYWAMISLTTVGYGDLYPVTAIGMVISMISSFIGIAIVALPAGIITAGYMQELDTDKKD